MMFFVILPGNSRFLVFQLILFYNRSNGAQAGMVQCYLVKRQEGYFYKLPKCRLLANSKCASMKKLYEAAGA